MSTRPKSRFEKPKRDTELIRWGFEDAGKEYDVIVYVKGKALVIDTPSFTRDYVAKHNTQEAQLVATAFMMENEAAAKYMYPLDIDFDLYYRLRECKKILDASEDADISTATEREITMALHEHFIRQVKSKLRG